MTGRRRVRSHPRGHPRRLRWLVLAGAVAIAGWGGFVAWSLVLFHSEIEAGRDAVRTVQGLQIDHLIDGTGNETLTEAHDRFAAASDRLDHPLMRPARLLPWAGRQLRSITALATSARDATDMADNALVGIADAVGDGLPAGPGRPAALGEVASVAGDLLRGFEGLDLGPEHALIGRLNDARTEFGREIDELTVRLETLVAVTDGLSGLLEGPHRYLVFAANNAQMQNGQGMFLDYGILETAGGELNLSEFRSVPDLPNPTAPVALDPDIAAAWPWMDPNRDWRHLGTTARFPATAATAQALWTAVGQPPVDGVISIDAVALRSLLTLAGPVDVAGRTIDAESVESYLLHDQYVEYFGSGPTTEAAQLAREDRLRSVANATLDAIDGTSSLDLAALAPVAETLQNRHLMAWSSIAAQQRAFEAAGIDGSVPADGLLVSVVNRGANKLDWFLDVTADVGVEASSEGDQVTVTVLVHNAVDPAIEPAYIAGPYDHGLAAGQYLGVVTATIPGAATNVTVERGEVVVAGDDGDSILYGARVVVDPGGDATVVFRFEMRPGDLEHLVLQPSGRVHRVEWLIDGQPATDPNVSLASP
ncbi:MAG: DUF4012 domain-containing protein [Acidimicrobiales bacterium]